ncbi:MAG: hypothetical protein NTV06_06445, partial [candidate division Zixibacteria bacterium]|nr:hypothetical protein [candidate division Zixibacteria bacterium]
AKSADDTQRIEQAIQEYVEGHDENPNAHMGAEYSLGSHRLQTLLDHPYDSIKWWHVYDIHAEKITAGGMVIKGAGPYISVQDPAGAERVKIYPEGIIIKKGKLWLQDENDIAILDPQGLVGSNIFVGDNTEKSSNQDIVGVTPTDVTEFSYTITTTRETPILLFGSVFMMSPDGHYGYIKIKINNEQIPDPVHLESWTLRLDTFDEVYIFPIIYIVYLPEGENVVKIQCGASGAGKTLTIVEGSNFGYVRLGT